MKIVVTGARGQLGHALKEQSKYTPGIDIYFADSTEADITDKASLQDIFKRLKPQYCINAAAYTAVDKAESEPQKAHAINVLGAKNLAEVCLEHECVLLHISTDFVFNGTKRTPYTEDDAPNPQSVYGITKLQGEAEVQKVLKQYFIVRTSWVYSEYGNNFMKTMLRLASERDALNVVDDQVGTPTNANDLAVALFKITQAKSTAYGIYNYSNEGQTTWYGFAKKIFEVNNVKINLQPIATSAYPTPAKRPAYSVLDKTKIKKEFGITIPNWEDTVKNERS